jgi:2-hydroxy-6-oxonona-2,4-dienedioate hydrolase
VKEQLPELDETWVTAGGWRIFTRFCTRSSGSQLPIVLVHGLSVSSLYMVPVARELARSASVYALDLPGFGKSEKPQGRSANLWQLTEMLREWMDRLGLEQAAMVGNSLGCQIIIDFALKYPQRITHAVLTGPTMDPRARSDLRQIERGLRNVLFYEPAALIPILARTYLRAGLRRTFQTLHYALQDPVEEKLPLVHVPALVVRGEHDIIVPTAWAKEAASLLPDARFTVIPGGAHAVVFDRPAVLAALITDFVRQ